MSTIGTLMLDFNNFLTEQKNTHMTHIEDKVLYGSVNGTRFWHIRTTRYARHAFWQKEGSVSVKWDGARIFAGTDHGTGNSS